MNNEEHNSFSGSLYFPTRRAADFWRALEADGRVSGKIETLVSGWCRFVIDANEKWAELDAHSSNGYKYAFLVRKGSHGRAMILANKSELVEKLLKEIGLEDWINNTPNVDVVGLLNDLMQTPRSTEYTVGAIYARVNAFRGALRTIILYGNDVADASLFKDSIAQWIEPYRLNLKYSKSYEVMSISENGNITFNYKDLSSLKQIDQAIKTIGQTLRRLNWEVEGEGDE